MSDLSDVTNDEIREILDNIKARTNRDDISGDMIREWSREDIDRLLEITRGTTHVSDIAKLEAEITEAEYVEDDVVPESEPEMEGAASQIEFENIIVDDEDPLEDPEDEDDEDIKIANSVEENEITYYDDLEKALDLDEQDYVSIKKSERDLKDILEGGESKKKSVDISAIFGETKGSFSAFAKKIKKVSVKLKDSFKTEDENDNERFNLSEDDEFVEDEFEVNDEELNDIDEDEDIKIADFSQKEEKTMVIPTDEEKTIYIEKPGIVIKKGANSDDEELEGAPTIMSADDALENDRKAKIPTIEKMQNDLQSRLREAQEDGQIILSGFEDTTDEKPERIDEEQAERELFEKRKKKIDKFVLFGDDDDPYGSDAEKEKIGELFDTNEYRPRHREAEKFEGVEYAQTKDARRVQRYINSLKKKSFNRVIGQCALFVLAVITGIASAMKTTVAGDRFMTIFISLILITASLIVSGQNILDSFELLKKKRFNINTVISFTAIFCFLQTFLMFVLYFVKINPVSVFGCAGVGLLLIGELNSYVINSRTADAMELCTGDNKDKLYSIESISDYKDILELGKNIRSKGPRIRYSCKTRFPSHLIEMCISETMADKRSKLIMFVIALMSIINFVVAWIVNGKFPVAFAAFTVTLSTCVPAYGALLVQLPLRWTNKKINCDGAMVSCQDAVNELYRTNAIVLDSKDLFDQSKCEMLGFKDFKNVRMDDAMLYAAAMVIRSGGPLTGVFDQMVVNRRDILPTVKSFRYEEKLGVSGWIYNQKVILGNRSLMVNHNISVPLSIDEDKYLMHGHEVMYLAIADKLAAMIVVDYAPNRKLAPYLKKLRDSGVSILVRNCDPNVTERMISDCFDMRLDNIKIINSASGRVFKKYKSRPKVATHAVSVHDGSTYAFLRTLCTAAMLRHTFKIADLLMYIGMGMGFAIMLVLSILNVVADLPAIFVILLQAVITGAFIGVTRIVCGK